MKIVMWACFILALVAALAYVLMGLGVITAGNLVEKGDKLPVFYYVIPVAYIIMGAAIFVKKRWILITDAAITLFTILVFYTEYASQPDVMWSAPGIITKIAQILLLAGLVYLITKVKPEPKATKSAA